MMIRDFLQSKWFTLTGLVVLVMMVVALTRRFPTLASIQQEVSRAEQKINDAQRSQTELQEKQKYSHSVSYLERQARLQLNYKKPGEEVVYVYRQDESPSTGPGQASFARNRSNLRQWWDYIMGD